MNATGIHLGNKSIILKITLLCLYSMSLTFCTSQSREKREYKVLIDSNSQGSLYIFNDSVLFQSSSGKSYFKDFEKGLEIASMKLKSGDTIIRLYPNYMISYSFYKDKFDTLLYSNKINYIDNLIVKDSNIIIYASKVIIFNSKTNTTILEKYSPFYQQNLMIQDSTVYLLFSSELKQTDLIEINLKTLEEKILARFNYENVLFREHQKKWTGMYLHNNLLFIQFLEKMVVFDLNDKSIISEYRSPYTETTLLEQNDEYILFMNDIKEKFKFVYKEKKFVWL